MSNQRLERWIARKLRLRHLELVAKVYDQRSILKAARHLNLTQPAVTKSLKDIEGTLGLPLFERTNRGLNATPYGEIFSRHAKIILAQLRHCAEELGNLSSGYSGHVYVGTLLSGSARLLPEAMAMLKKDRPRIAITVLEGTYDVLLPALTAGDIDFVLGRLPEVGRTRYLRYERFYSEPACLVVRSGHPLTKRKRLALRDLYDEPWLMPVSETALRRQVERAFDAAGLPLPLNVIESMSTTANRSLIRQTDYIGVLPMQVALDDVDHGLISILPVRLKGTVRPVGVIMRATGTLPPAAAAFLGCLRTVGRNIAARHPA